MQSYNPTAARHCGLGCFLFARHYSGNHVCFLFLQVLRCFSSLGWLPFGYHIFNMIGCPIRKSADLMLVCSSPQLIAAYHVLHRLLEPRHPPCALICFKTIQIFKSLTSLKVTRYYNFIPNMSKSYYLSLPLPFHVHSLPDRFLPDIRRCAGLEPGDSPTPCGL